MCEDCSVGLGSGWAAVGAGVRGEHELGLGCDGMWLGQGRWIWWASVVVAGRLVGLEVGDAVLVWAAVAVAVLSMQII